MDQPPRFTRKVCSQLLRLLKAFLLGDGRRKGRGLLVLLIVFSIAVTGASVLMSYANRDFMTALSKRDSSGYWRSLWIYISLFGLAIPLAAFYRYTEERLALNWRDWLTRTLLKRYFNNRAYYRLQTSETIDNPDQRISEDVKNFTTTTLSFLLIALNSIIQLIAFTGVLWSISGTLVTVLIGYSLLGTVGTFIIGRRLVGLHYLQYGREADLRYSLVRVRDHAESVAFYRGERREFRDLLSRLGGVVGNMSVLIGWNRNLAFFTTGYNYVALVLPVLITAPLFLAGKIEFGVIPQAAGAFAAMLAAVSLIITQFERLSAFAASVSRVGALWDELDEHDAEEDVDAAPKQIDVTEDQRRLTLEKLTVTTPNGQRTLLRELSLKLPPEGSLLIMGESGTGKSSLLRTIAGLWNSGEGKLSRPAFRNMMFLPQRPYMVPGSLRAQLVYPAAANDTADEALGDVLRTVNLPALPDRVDGDYSREADWANMLSLGEQQRVSFARLLLNKPTVAFLDEATSALDEPNEERLYQHIRDNKFTYISVGHRSTLLKHHDYVLEIKKDGSWVLEKGQDVIERRFAAEIAAAATESSA